jgi:hypothetical protein
MRIDNNSTIGSIPIDNGNWFPFPPLRFQPDLYIDESKIIWEKNKKRIDFKIKNKGIADSKHFLISIYTKEKNGIIKILKRFYISKLEIRKTIEKSFEITQPINNIKEIIIKVDSNHEVKELDEMNNIKIIEFNKKINYTIEVETGNVPYAGTDAGVYIKLYGIAENSDYIQLDNSENNYEKDKKDTYTILHKDIGSIRKIEIKHDNKGKHPGWFLKKVLIKDNSDDYNFTANEWLSSSSRSEHPTITLLEDDLREEYRVTVVTSNIKNAGTDATVYIRLYGDDNRKTPLQRIGQELSDFEQGNSKTYIIRSNFNLGDIKKIYIEHDNTGKGPWWHIEKVIVTNNSSNNKSTFTINKWLHGQDAKIIVFKDSPIKELILDATRQIKIDKSDNLEKITLLTDGTKYLFNHCKSGPYQGCAIDAAHSFMGWFKNTISRDTIHRYVETTDYTDTWFGDIRNGDILTSPAQMEYGLKRLVNKIQPRYRNKIIKQQINDNHIIIEEIRNYLRSGMPVVALINKGYHWVTIVGMECHYTSTKTIDLKKSKITYIDLTNSFTFTKSYYDLKICGWSSFWGQLIYPSYKPGTIISLHNSLLKSSYVKKAYRFEIYTSKVLKAGTDAHIQITINGKNNQSLTYTVDTICNDFEKGSKTVQSFIVDTYLPEIQSIVINRDNSGKNPDWHISYIDVIETEVGEEVGEKVGEKWHFPIYDWIDSTQHEIYPHAQKNSYTIKVKTGNIKDAGTDARVYIKLYGSSGTSKFLQLDDLKNNHEKGNLDIYTIPYKNIGSIQKIEIKHDSTGNKAGWYLEKISIDNKSNTYSFTIGEWLLYGSGSIFSIEDHLR